MRLRSLPLQFKAGDRVPVCSSEAWLGRLQHACFVTIESPADARGHVKIRYGQPLATHVIDIHKSLLRPLTVSSASAATAPNSDLRRLHEG